LGGVTRVAGLGLRPGQKKREEVGRNQSTRFLSLGPKKGLNTGQVGLDPEKMLGELPCDEQPRMSRKGSRHRTNERKRGRHMGNAKKKKVVVAKTVIAQVFKSGRGGR